MKFPKKRKVIHYFISTLIMNELESIPFLILNFSWTLKVRYFWISKNHSKYKYQINAQQYFSLHFPVSSHFKVILSLTRKLTFQDCKVYENVHERQQCSFPCTWRQCFGPEPVQKVPDPPRMWSRWCPSLWTEWAEHLQVDLGSRTDENLVSANWSPDPPDIVAGI